jgi:hypothetical protein
VKLDVTALRITLDIFPNGAVKNLYLISKERAVLELSSTGIRNKTPEPTVPNIKGKKRDITSFLNRFADLSLTAFENSCPLCPVSMSVCLVFPSYLLKSGQSTV